MLDFPQLKVEQVDQICLITIDRPKSLNAINQTVMQSLFDVFASLQKET